MFAKGLLASHRSLPGPHGADIPLALMQVLVATEPGAASKQRASHMTAIAKSNFAELLPNQTSLLALSPSGCQSVLPTS
jgi:hypothetical protein